MTLVNNYTLEIRLHTHLMLNLMQFGPIIRTEVLRGHFVIIIIA